MEIIRFYDEEQPYFEFSNFYTNKKFKIVLDNITYISVEQYFQAQKFYIPDSYRHMEYFKIICSSDRMSKVFMLGTQCPRYGYASNWVVNRITDRRHLNSVIDDYKDIKIRKDWDRIRLELMEKGVRAKFTQNDSIKEMLLSTGDLEIEENSMIDSFWGIGRDGKGRNNMGKILMKLREEFRFENEV
jgi:predicted NAD-dependent protein-ADP-ribosyltransferase YbiA (DUF1768 family)